MFVSETYGIEDCKYYDGSGSKSYTASTGTFSYDSNNGGYKFSNASSGVIATVPSLTVPKGTIIECDMKFPSDGGFMAIGVYDGSKYIRTVMKRWTDNNAIFLSNTTSLAGVSEISSSVFSTYTYQYNHWYHFTLEIGDNLVAKLYDGDTLIKTLSISNTYITGNNNTVHFYAYSTVTNRYYKNLKIKPL